MTDAQIEMDAESESPLWQSGSGGLLWAQMLDISSRVKGQFTALDALSATFSDLYWLSQQTGSAVDRLQALLARRQSRPAARSLLDNLLPEALASGSGGSSLGVAIWAAALAEQAAIDCYPLLLAGNLLLVVEERGDSHLLEPVSGQRCDQRQLDAMVRVSRGDWQRWTPSLLQRPNEAEVLSRWLLELRALLIAHEQWDEALVVTSEQLRRQPDDLYARRDRGFVLDQLDCGELARLDFERFVKECPDDPSIPLLRQRLQELAGEQLVRH